MRWTTWCMTWTVVGAALLLSACASDSDPEEQKIDPKTGLPFCSDDQGSEACVDSEGAVLCAANSGYPGDELAICQPDPTKGLLLHYGPKNYNDEAEVAKYLLGPGEEDENCVIVHSPNQADALVRNFHGRMRPNSHHLIVTTLSGDVSDSDGPIACNQRDNVGQRWLLGSQDPQIDVHIAGGAYPPQSGDPDYGLAQALAGNAPIKIDMHYINTTNETILREAWIYLDYAPESEVENLVDMITFFQGDISVPPQGSSETAKGACVAPTERYVGLLTGHFHENGDRFSAWKRDAAGVETLVYETYDWEDPGNLFYNARRTNTPPDPSTLTMGGLNGYLPLKVGESLVFQCAFSNPTNETVTLGDMGRDQMCNTFGMYYPTDGNVWDCTCLGSQCF